MDGVEQQLALFKRLRESMPPHLSMAEELASLLGVSADSAYRRIRGEKALDIGELAVLSKHYKISLDTLLAPGSHNVVFNGHFVGISGFSFADWLTSVNIQLDNAALGREKTVFIFQAKDIPLFHHFQVPELALFKFFFWRRTILQDARFRDSKFSLSDREDDLLALGRKTFLNYLRFPSIEIWNVESLNSTLRQIAYYREAGTFVSESEAQLLFDKLLELLAHLEAQTAAGVKFALGQPVSDGLADYQVYVNEVMLGDNMIYSDNGRTRTVFINHGVINYIGTTDERFVTETGHNLRNIMSKSALISGVGEKERNRFFKAMREEIVQRRR